MKLLVRFLLFFSFLVLGTGSFLFAHSEPHSATLSIRQGHPGVKVPNYKLKATQVEEDEDENEDKAGAAKKQSGAKNYFTAFLFANTGEHLNTNLNCCLPFGRHFFCTSPPKYIMYRVFRV